MIDFEGNQLPFVGHGTALLVLVPCIGQRRLDGLVFLFRAFLNLAASRFPDRVLGLMAVLCGHFSVPLLQSMGQYSPRRLRLVCARVDTWV